SLASPVRLMGRRRIRSTTSTGLLGLLGIALTSHCQAAPVLAPGGGGAAPAARAELAYTLTGHSLCVYHVVFSPDGKRLSTSSKDKTVKLWDPATGAEVRTLRGHSAEVYSSAF